MSLREMVRSLIREELPGEPMISTSESISTGSSNASLVATRQSIFTRLAALREKAGSIDAEKMKISIDEERLAKLEADAEILRARIAEQHRESHSQYLDVSFAIDKDLTLLQCHCSPIIRQFIDSMNAEYERLANLPCRTGVAYGEKNILADNPMVPRFPLSNAPAIQRRVRAVLAARARAEELKVLDRTEEELIQELNGLRLALPTIAGELERIIGE